MFEPIPDAPAAIGPEDTLVVADVHAGIEAEYRREGVVIETDTEDRRERLLALIDEYDPGRLVVAGDLGTSIGRPEGPEREEIRSLLAACRDRLPVTVVPGNHDGDLSAVVDADVEIAPPTGITVDGLGICHGHTWPDEALLATDTLALGHEHPRVRLTDAVGGGRTVRVWLRGHLDPGPLVEEGFDIGDTTPEVVVMPAFNERSGGTPLNAPGRSFLSPVLEAALCDPEAFLFDGTRLGPLEAL